MFNIEITWIVWIWGWHFIADFMCQSHNMASMKSHNWIALNAHTGTYALIMTCALYITMYMVQGVPLAFLVTFLAFWLPHTVVDAVTSRMSAYRWAKSEWHVFFVVIGFDQFLHFLHVLFVLRWVGVL